jgi:hypothetical protein
MTDTPRKPPPDVVTTEGFPKGWYMVHRTDTTLLVRQAELGMLFPTTLCAAPKLLQGNAWLDTARMIAWAVSQEIQRDRDAIFAAFCDRCGMGPTCDEHGDTNPNVRALRTWTCQDCDHVNVRQSPSSGPNG